MFDRPISIGIAIRGTEDQIREAASVREDSVAYKYMEEIKLPTIRIASLVSARDQNRRGGSAIVPCSRARLDPILVVASADDQGEPLEFMPGA